MIKKLLSNTDLHTPVGLRVRNSRRDGKAPESPTGASPSWRDPNEGQTHGGTRVAAPTGPSPPCCPQAWWQPWRHTFPKHNRWFFCDVALRAALFHAWSRYLKHSNPGDPTHGSFTGGTLQQHNSPAAHVEPPLSSMTVLYDLFSTVCPQIRRKYLTPKTYSSCFYFFCVFILFFFKFNAPQGSRCGYWNGLHTFKYAYNLQAHVLRCSVPKPCWQQLGSEAPSPQHKASLKLGSTSMGRRSRFARAAAWCWSLFL